MWTVKRNNFTVNQPNSSRTKCFDCHRTIKAKDIRIRRKKYDHSRFFHLPCFYPEIQLYICPNDISVELSQDAVPIFNDWLKSWNSNFFILDPSEEITPSVERKIKTSEIETSFDYCKIFEFMEAKEIFLVLSRVSKLFYRASWVQHLWKYLLIRDFKADAVCENYKELYVKYMLNCCFFCRNRSEKVERCPLIKKTICNDCLLSKKLKILHPIMIKQKYNIYYKLLGIKFIYNNTDTLFSYKFLVVEAVLHLRNSVKTKIIEFFLRLFNEESEIIKKIQSINTVKMENKSKNSYPKINSYSSAIPHCMNKRTYGVLYSMIRCGKYSEYVLINLVPDILKDQLS